MNLKSRSWILARIWTFKRCFKWLLRTENTEKGLQIDVFALRESQEFGDLAKSNWLPDKLSPTDALTKKYFGATSALLQLMQTGIIDLKVLRWKTSPQKQKGWSVDHDDQVKFEKLLKPGLKY